MRGVMFRTGLDALARRPLRRRLRTIDSAPAPEVELEGRRILLSPPNNYWALPPHPGVTEAAINAVRRYGVGAGASRLVSGSLRPHRELEARLAAFKRVEAALVFPTGYQANLGLITTLAEACSVLYADRLCHASLIDACRLCDAPLRVYRHRDHAQLTRLLQRKRAPHPALVVTDGVFSMDGDLAPLPELDKAAEQTGAGRGGGGGAPPSPASAAAPGGGSATPGPPAPPPSRPPWGARGRRPPPPPPSSPPAPPPPPSPP